MYLFTPSTEAEYSEYEAILDEIKRKTAIERAKFEDSWRDYHDDIDYMEEYAALEFEAQYIDKQWWGQEYYKVREKLYADRTIPHEELKEMAKNIAINRLTRLPELPPQLEKLNCTRNDCVALLTVCIGGCLYGLCV